ncbi:hypothetical protein PMAYCL1PPCAC_15622, partial [Pristionchus mayeri]
LKRSLLLILTISAVLVGIGLGLALRSMHLSHSTLQIMRFPGEIFMQVLRMMVLPLIVTSVISSLGQMKTGPASMMGLMTLAYYVTTAVFATVVGIACVTTIQPGALLADSDGQNRTELATGEVEPIDTFLDLVRNMFPDNIFRATFQRVSTKYYRGNGTTLVKKVVDAPGTNILGIIVFSTLFGLVVSRQGRKVRIMVEFFLALYKIIMGYIMAAMWFAPIGIVSLISGNLLEVEDLSDTFEVHLYHTAKNGILVQSLAMYLLTVLLGLFIHILITTPLLFFIVTRKSPLPVYKTMMEPFMIALGTASSGAALPTSIQCLEEHGIDSRIAHFVPSFGNTLNVVRSLVSMMLILNTVGLPVKDIALIITVDWLIDRIRTAINVMGDGFATCFIAHNV